MQTSGSEFLVSYGKSGAFGRFAPAEPLTLVRGDRVVVQSARGLELGSVLCAGTEGHARLLGRDAVGRLLRRAGADDDDAAARCTRLARTLFDDALALVQEDGLALDILDTEVLLDGRQAIVQCLGDAATTAQTLAARLSQRHQLTILLENLAEPALPAHEESTGGCGKPDCGRLNGKSGGCSDCSSGGGCSSCGSGHVDLRAYFAHLRTQMESRQRTPLL